MPVSQNEGPASKNQPGGFGRIEKVPKGLLY